MEHKKIKIFNGLKQHNQEGELKEKLQKIEDKRAKLNEFLNLVAMETLIDDFTNKMSVEQDPVPEPEPNPEPKPKKPREEKLQDQRRYNRTYYTKHEKTLKEPITCLCGGRYTILNRSHHFKSNKHKKLERDLTHKIMTLNFII